MRGRGRAKKRRVPPSRKVRPWGLAAPRTALLIHGFVDGTSRAAEDLLLAAEVAECKHRLTY